MNSTREATSGPVGAAPPETPAAAVELHGLGKVYGSETAVRDLDLTVEPGEFIAVLGASGSGKSTLLKMVAGFESPSHGGVHLHGRDVSSLSPADREIGMVVQNYALFPHMSVAGNIEYGLRTRRWPRARRRERVREMLERMRLTALGERLPRQLSGGQQQRVAIARALAYSPRIMLMDEPLGALDKALKEDMIEEIHRVHREFSTTILYVTHDREEAMTLADRVLLMRSGRMVACDPVEDLFNRPRSAFVASFFSGANVLPARVSSLGGGLANVELGGSVQRVPCEGDPTDGPMALTVRPTGVSVPPDPDAPGWSLVGEVTDRLFLGDSVKIKIAYTDAGVRGRVDCLMPADHPHVGVGETVRFGFDTGTARVVPDDREER